MAMSLACIWSVSINGVKLPLERKRHINQIKVSENCNGSDTATITIFDKDMEYINDNIYVEDATISINMNFVGLDGKITFDGFISAIDIDFPEEGVPVMVLHCLDKSHVMNRTKKKRSFKKMTRMAVARQIAQEYGFKFEGSYSYSGKVKDTITQSRQTDIEFLESLANAEKPKLYLCKLVGDTLVYKERGTLSAPVTSLHYKEYPYEVRSFSPQINKESMEYKSEASDIATDTKETDSATSDGTGETQGEAVNSNAYQQFNSDKQSWSKVESTDETRSTPLKPKAGTVQVVTTSKGTTYRSSGRR